MKYMKITYVDRNNSETGKVIIDEENNGIYRWNSNYKKWIETRFKSFGYANTTIDRSGNVTIIGLEQWQPEVGKSPIFFDNSSFKFKAHPVRIGDIVEGTLEGLLKD